MPASLHGVDLAVWRSASGRLSAWKDRCPHRGMRLSHGFVRGETLSCIYHGWVYGTDGGCNRIPAHPDLVPPAAIKAETFACMETHGVIWIGTADAKGDVPDLDGMQGLRSMTFACHADDLVRALPEFDATRAGVLRGETAVAGHPAKICLLLQDGGQARTIVHAMCAAGDDGIAVSRWLEGLRRQTEEGMAA
jgi:nitrite reductase/ring-hydroxylating ferredoxin subunit